MHPELYNYWLMRAETVVDFLTGDADVALEEVPRILHMKDELKGEIILLLKEHDVFTDIMIAANRRHNRLLQHVKAIQESQKELESEGMDFGTIETMQKAMDEINQMADEMDTPALKSMSCWSKLLHNQPEESKDMVIFIGVYFEIRRRQQELLSG